MPTNDVESLIVELAGKLRDIDPGTRYKIEMPDGSIKSELGITLIVLAAIEVTDAEYRKTGVRPRISTAMKRLEAAL